jgi:Flp pilus assembly pilin Flp
VKNLMMNFIRDEQGQDLIEYTLLLAFVCLASAAIFIGMGGNLATIWTNASKIAKNASSAFS